MFIDRAGLFSTVLDPLADDLLRGGDVKDGDPVMWVCLPDLPEYLGARLEMLPWEHV